MAPDDRSQPADSIVPGLMPLPGRVRLATLVLLRWLGIAGQLLAVFTVYFGLRYPLPLLYCLLVIGASAVLNIIVSLRYPSIKRLTARETAAYLAFDIIQLSAMLALTGGLQNPFALLVIAPVVISATTLPPRSTIVLMVLAFVAVTFLAFYHWPLPWFSDAPLRLPVTYVVGLWSALVLGIGFTSVYAWRIATEAKRMSEALSATQAVLAREQRMSAVGGLAAAAAHELGTPLATIALVAKELRHALPSKGPLAEDVTLLGSQVERCREILRRLSVRPEESEGALGEAAIGAVLEEIIAPHQGFGIMIELSLPDDHAQQPLVRRSPELLHGLGNLIENAVDFAKNRVQVEARWDDARVTVTVTDDGPGFLPEVLDRLGEPYVTTRGALAGVSEGEPDVPQGMGLGFFIAKTLLERIGGKISVANLGGTGGASVTLSWPRGPAQAASVAAAAPVPQAAL